MSSKPLHSSRNSGIGDEIHALAKRLWPLNRSISGPGLRETLNILREHLPEMRLIEVPSGSKVLDWIVPDEWEINSGWLEGPDGEKVVDFADNNLHVVGYSEGIEKTLTLDELQPHLHSLPDQPDAIPYVTSYYNRTWGFCLSHQQRETLEPGQYRTRIDASHYPGSITLGELIIPGREGKEILLSTYCCHPSMANNELSGPCLTTFLARWIQGMENRRYTYRIVFVPEMIGSIAYLHHHMEEMKARTIAGFNITCVGDERTWSYLPSRQGDTLSDQVALHVLRHQAGEYDEYTWLDRGSDESNYCAPGVDLPVATVMRSKYGVYPEYHTSLDDLHHLVTPDGLEQSYRLYCRMLEALEVNGYPRTRVFGEPQLGRRGLYPSISKKGSTDTVRTLLDVISYCDGKHTVIDIAERLSKPFEEIESILENLKRNGLIEQS